MILVAGGSGRLGSLVVRHLTDSGLKVRVLTRDIARARLALPAEVELVLGDVRDEDAVAAAASGVEVVVSAVQGLTGRRGCSPASVDRDGNRHLVAAAQASGAHVVLLSVVGAAPDSPMELFRMKYAAEQQLIASGVPYTIVSASAFLELWIDLLQKSAERGGRPVVLGPGAVSRNFVSVIDVAALVASVVDDAGSRGRHLQIFGPENLTLTEIASAVQVAAGRTSAPRHIPRGVLRIIAGTIGRIDPAIGRVLRTSLDSDLIDLTAQPNGLRSEYPGVPLTTLADCLAAS